MRPLARSVWVPIRDGCLWGGRSCRSINCHSRVDYRRPTSPTPQQCRPFHRRVSSFIPPLPPPPPKPAALKTRPRTALFFPGQGVQKVGMLTPWLEAFPKTAGPVIQEMDDLLGYRLSTVIQRGPNRLLTETAHAQPAIMATSILILKILEKDYGFVVADRVDVTLGHSLGEFAALVAGGYLTFADGLALVRRRAESMETCTAARLQKGDNGKYGMVAVVTEPSYLEKLITAVDAEIQRHDGDAGSVSIANINSKNQIVLSGHLQRIDDLLHRVRLFLGHDPRAVRLNSDSPFHSPIMRPVVGQMREWLRDDVIHFPGTLPCISNVSARPFSSRNDVRDLLARQAEETIHWWDSIRYLDQTERVRRWVGIGPGKVGRNLVGKEVGMRGKDVVKGGGVWAVTAPGEIEEVLRGLEETEKFVEWEDDEDMERED